MVGLARAAATSVLALTFASTLVSCQIYNESMFESRGSSVGGAFSSGGFGSGSAATGGGSTGGGSSGGGTASGGVTGSGGFSGTGGIANTGGTGGEVGSGGSGGTSTGGGMGTGGTGGGLGNSLEYELIDNMDDGNIDIENIEGRRGYWYAYDDGSGGSATPSSGQPFGLTARPDAENNYAINLVAADFSAWGAGVGVNVNDDGLTAHAYDASAYDGVSFWARVGPGSETTVRVGISDVNSDAAGGVCSGPNCGDHHGMTLEFTEEWAQYHLKFSEITRLNFGPPAGSIFQPDKMYGVQFTAATVNADVDLWIDDLEFFVEVPP